MGSAQLDLPPTGAILLGTPADDAAPTPLRQQMAERLAAHRARRQRQTSIQTGAQALLDINRTPKLPQGKQKIAATVAERYAQSPSYRAFLAEEAQRAIRQAEAAAEVAARTAEAVATAQQQLLAELELWTAPQLFSAETAQLQSAQNPSLPHSSQPHRDEWEPEMSSPLAKQNPEPPAGLVIRLYEDPVESPSRTLPEMHRNEPLPITDPEEAEALDEEIAFRRTPVFDDFRDFGGKVEPLPANLVEFPRQLIATRKARPRLAEGPLRDESPLTPQLRIFEVEPEMPSPFPEALTNAPEWSTIRLTAQTNAAPAPYVPGDAIASIPLPPQTAPMERRILAVLTDLTLILLAFTAFTALAVFISGTVPSGLEAAKIAAGAVAALYLLYQALFFTLSDQTPGMRFARIGFCTLSDENPTRQAMRRRILALLVALTPLGIGVLWAFLDDDRLGWHDRISRMYQRAY